MINVCVTGIFNIRRIFNGYDLGSNRVTKYVFYECNEKHVCVPVRYNYRKEPHACFGCFALVSGYKRKKFKKVVDGTKVSFIDADEGKKPSWVLHLNSNGS